uniref:Uncharacterized protein n=1 Tax=Rhizophora mucronata TaxID=61149 RepID=A0A2P2PY23_RHIMU
MLLREQDQHNLHSFLRNKMKNFRPLFKYLAG